MCENPLDSIQVAGSCCSYAGIRPPETPIIEPLEDSYATLLGCCATNFQGLQRQRASVLRTSQSRTAVLPLLQRLHKDSRPRYSPHPYTILTDLVDYIWLRYLIATSWSLQAALHTTQQSSDRKQPVDSVLRQHTPKRLDAHVLFGTCADMSADNDIGIMCSRSVANCNQMCESTNPKSLINAAKIQPEDGRDCQKV